METISEKANNAAKVANKDFDFLEAMLNDGTLIKVSKADIMAMINEAKQDAAMQDNVFIMCHQKTDGATLLVSPNSWKNYESQGEKADGVVIIDGTKKIVITPTQAAQS